MKDFIRQKLRENLNESQVDESLKSAALGGALALSTMMGGNLNANPSNINNTKPEITNPIKDKPQVYLNGKLIDVNLSDLLNNIGSMIESGKIVGYGKSMDDATAYKKAKQLFLQQGANIGVQSNNDTYKVIQPNGDITYFLIKK